MREYTEEEIGIRRGIVGDMTKSMDFDTDKEVEMYEQSIELLSDENNPKCLKDLVMGYNDDKNLDIQSTLDSKITYLGAGYSDKEFVFELGKSLTLLKGIADGVVEMYVEMFICEEDYREQYIKLLGEMGDEDLNYHRSILEKVLGGYREQGEVECEDRTKTILRGLRIK